MSWDNDGSAELDAAVKSIRALGPREIAKKLAEWETNGVKIGWVDFTNRAVLETADRHLRVMSDLLHDLCEDVVGAIDEYRKWAGCGFLEFGHDERRCRHCVAERLCSMKDKLARTAKEYASAERRSEEGAECEDQKTKSDT